MARGRDESGEGSKRRKYDTGERSLSQVAKESRRAFRGEGSGDAPSGSRVEGHDEMIGRNDYAGLPSDVKMQLYPKGARLTKNEGLDDTMSDIDDVNERAEMKRRNYISWQK